MKTRNCIFLLIVCFLIACSSVASPTATPTQPKPTSTFTPTSTNTPSPTQPPDQFIIEGGELKEFVNGAYSPVEKLSSDIQYKIGTDGRPIAYYPVDSRLFDNSDSVQIAVRENGQWVMNNSIILIQNQQNLQMLNENSTGDPNQRWNVWENSVRHDISVTRTGDIIGLRLTGDMTRNQGSIQFLMNFNNTGKNELLLAEPPEISQQNVIEGRLQDPQIYLNGKLSVTDVINILAAYQNSLSNDNSIHYISSLVFTNGLKTWIDQQLQRDSSWNLDVVCNWLGVPVPSLNFNSPTVIDVCKRLYGDPASRLSSDQVLGIMNSNIQSNKEAALQLNSETLWSNNLSVLKPMDQFWFYVGIQTSQ